ncbi:MAG TPA: glycosyltransferase family 9 protein [Methylomirabilota bacterium]
MTTLAIHPGALGDVLLAIPALRGLRALTPPSPLVIAAQPRIGGLLTALGEVDKARDFEALGLDTLFAGDLPSGALAIVREARSVVCWFGAGDADFARRLRAMAPNAIVAPSAVAGVPTWRHLLATTGAADAPRACIAVPGLLAAAGRRLLAEAGWDGERGVAIVHPGAGSVRKRWATAGFAAVVNALGESGSFVALHEGPADAASVADLSVALARRVAVLHEPPLPALAGALHLARAYVGNDSGVSHLAAAVGTPSLILFASALLAWAPWARQARVMTVSMGDGAERDVDAVTAAALALVRAETPA